MAQPTFDWTWIDTIWCINLAERPDRKAHMLDVAKRLDLPLTFYHPTRHPKGGEQGCWESHIACLRQAYQRGDRLTLILEDDAVPTRDLTPAALDRVRDALQGKWYLLFLGYVPDIRHTSLKRISPGIYQGHFLQAHAYIASRAFMKRILTMEYFGIGWDYFLSTFPAYGVYPILFEQSSSPSDISEFPMTRFRPWMSHVVVEWAVHVGGTVIMVLVAIIAILAIALVIVVST